MKQRRHDVITMIFSMVLCPKTEKKYFYEQIKAKKRQNRWCVNRQGSETNYTRFAAKLFFFPLTHFGHLSHSCIKTRHNSVYQPMLQPLRRRCAEMRASPRTECARKTTHICGANKQIWNDRGAWSLLLLAATGWSFAHMPLGISDRNTYIFKHFDWNVLIFFRSF